MQKGVVLVAAFKKFASKILNILKKSKLLAKLKKLVTTPSKTIALLSVVLGVIILVTVGWFLIESFNPPNIMLRDYITVTDVGYDGYGTVNAEINYAKLLRACAEASTVGKQQSNYSKAMEFVKQEKPFSVVIEEKEYSNGDVVQISFRKGSETCRKIEDIFGVSLSPVGVKHKVENLTKLIDYDPFDDLVISNNNSISGKGTLVFTIVHDDGENAWKWDVMHNGTDGSISNGDVLRLSVTGMPDAESIGRQYGLIVKTTSRDYVVDSLNEIPNSESVFNYDDTEIVKSVDKVANEWIVGGLNDESNQKYARVVEVYGKVFMTERKDKQLGNRLLYVYKVTEPENNLTYYAFLSPNKMYLINKKENKLVAAGDEGTPESLVYYQKETARYTARFGWGEYVDQGFLFNERAYAGHKTLNEELNYITKKYSGTYNQILLSHDLKAEAGK